MNLVLIITHTFISFFPTYVFRSNLNLLEIIFTLIIFSLLPSTVSLILLKIKLIKNRVLYLYISIISIYGFDNHLGLWVGIIEPYRNIISKYFSNIFLPSLILLVVITFSIYLLILIFNSNFIKVVFVFLITIFFLIYLIQQNPIKKLLILKMIIKTNLKKQMLF